jgi:hypothetical protein
VPSQFGQITDVTVEGNLVKIIKNLKEDRITNI